MEGADRRQRYCKFKIIRYVERISYGKTARNTNFNESSMCVLWCSGDETKISVHFHLGATLLISHLLNSVGIATS